MDKRSRATRVSGIFTHVHDLFALPDRSDSWLRDRLHALATGQQGVVRRDHLADLGLSRKAVDAMLDGRRWRAHGVVIIAMHNGPLTARQQLWAAVLNAGEFAAIAARTASAEYGLQGWNAEMIEILVAKGTCVPPGLGIDVKVHESRRFTAADLHPGRALPTVRVERALIDAAVWSARPRTACGILCAGVQQRLTTADKLTTELQGAGSVRFRKLLLSVLIDIDGGAQAMSEVDFLRFCRRNGLPRPILQEVRRDAKGRRRYLDATFLRSDGRLVRVEIDGALHLVVKTYWDDMYRGNELVIGREAGLRFASYVIHADDPAALDQIRRALGLSGSEPLLAG